MVYQVRVCTYYVLHDNYIIAQQSNGHIQIARSARPGFVLWVIRVQVEKNTDGFPRPAHRMPPRAMFNVCHVFHVCTFHSVVRAGLLALPSCPTTYDSSPTMHFLTPTPVSYTHLTLPTKA